ncbi:hypothetical protein CPB83DRAFT_725005, partial [Crepidotus variabilis]
NIVLVDTPGFDDSYTSDSDILFMIADWLKSKYPEGTCLAGILYLHRITNNRIIGTPNRNTRLFEKLCGGSGEGGKKVVFVTTMWDKLRDQDFGLQKEKEFQDFLAPTVRRGAQVRRYDNTKENAQQIILDLAEQPSSALTTPLEDELVKQKQLLERTEAARALYTQYQTLLAHHKTTIADIE